MGSNPVISGDVFKQHQYVREGMSRPRRRSIGYGTVVRNIASHPQFGPNVRLQAAKALRSVLAHVRFDERERSLLLSTIRNLRDGCHSNVLAASPAVS